MENKLFVIGEFDDVANKFKSDIDEVFKCSYKEIKSSTIKDILDAKSAIKEKFNTCLDEIKEEFEKLK